MGLSVSEILKLPILAGAQVLAGKKGLDREVKQVTVGEVPDIGDWLSGGELVLSTFFAAAKDPGAQVDFTRRIIKAGAAGLLVKPGRFVKTVDPELISLGSRHRFPIVEIPSDVRWTHIIAEISERIVGEHVSLLTRSRDIHTRLLEVVIDGGSWQSIVDITSELLGKPVVLEDSFHELLAKSAANGSAKALIDEFETRGHGDGGAGRPEGGRIQARAERYQRTPLKAGQEYPAAVTVPVAVSRDVLGYVSSFETESPLNELDLVALESAATVAAVEMGRELVRMETETRLRGDFVDDLVTGELESGPAIQKRASFLGGDLSRGCLVLIADIDSFGDYVRQESLTEQEVQQIKNRLFSGVKQVIGVRHADALLTPKSDNVIAFLPPLAGRADRLIDMAKASAKQILRACGRLLPELTVSVGIGRFHGDPAETRRAYREAQSALRVSQRLGETGVVVTFDDMGVYKLLLGAMEEDPEEVRNFYEETIARVEEYDARHNTDLLGTLEAYLANNRSVAATAEALFTHRHTIRYRLGRIADLTGLDVSRSEDQEKLSFGLKVMRLLRR
ncbi:MAG: PucR family transcriptional regulator ligand-binding domain-containing protein [Thermoleophilia bacterium]|nr:PucR family transcriptional regulator ligand-binding domain-containing protein [Thermoleophilia bacterium]